MKIMSSFMARALLIIRCSKHDVRSAMAVVALMMTLFGVVYYNQAHGRSSSFVWLSRTISPPAEYSAALNSDMAASQERSKLDAGSVLVYAPSPVPFPHDLQDFLPDPPLSSAPVQPSQAISTITQASYDQPKSEEISYSVSGTRDQIAPSSIPPESEKLDHVFEKENRTEAMDKQRKSDREFTADFNHAPENESSSSFVTDVEKAAAETASEVSVLQIGSTNAASVASDSVNITVGSEKQEHGQSPEEISWYYDLSPSSFTKDLQDFTNQKSSPQNQISDWRSSLELSLRNAKKAINMAPTVSNDADLYFPLYHNLSSFKMSYEMMEQVFKVYVYDEGETPLVRAGPMTGIYSSEGQFIDRMVHGNSFIVEDPKLAHMFFLPYSVAQLVETLYVPNSLTMQPINEYIRDYVNMLAAKHPFWNETRGTDHFVVACHDWGIATTVDHKELHQNAIKILCNADLADGFVLEKDASLPEIYLRSPKLPHRLGGPGPRKRPFLAFFAGQMHGRVRPSLIEHWKDKEPDMKIYEVIPQNVAIKMSYVQHMKSSKYCICAMGYEVNSPRIIEAIYYDCVPVIIADNFVLPFSDVLNWEAFSLTIPEKDIPNLRQILLNIPDHKYQTLQRRVKKVRQHFMWHDQVVRYDVFHMILHSVWNTRLKQISEE